MGILAKGRVDRVRRQCSYLAQQLCLSVFALTVKNFFASFESISGTDFIQGPRKTVFVLEGEMGRRVPC